jgi:hypothetical protein
MNPILKSILTAIARYLHTWLKLVLFVPAMLLMAAMVLVTSVYTLFCHAVLGTHVSFNDELETVMERFM